MPELPGEVKHLDVGFRRGGKIIGGGGPVEESEGLKERNAVADGAAFFDHATDERRGKRMDGGDSREIEGEIGDCEIRRRWSGFRVRVFAVMVFD